MAQIRARGGRCVVPPYRKSKIISQLKHNSENAPWHWHDIASFPPPPLQYGGAAVEMISCQTHAMARFCMSQNKLQHHIQCLTKKSVSKIYKPRALIFRALAAHNAVLGILCCKMQTLLAESRRISKLFPPGGSMQCRCALRVLPPPRAYPILPLGLTSWANSSRSTDCGF
jgi:hypothetical protein